MGNKRPRIPKPDPLRQLVNEENREEKVLVAVDLANIYCQVKTVHGGRPVSGNYKELIDEIVKPLDNVTVLCFAPISNPIEDIDGYSNTLGFHNYLRHMGYIIHTTERRNGKANCDVLLAVKTMEALAKCDYDRLVLVSADGDFAPLMMHAREHGVKTTAASIDSLMSTGLKHSCNEFIDLSDWATSVVGKDGNIDTARGHSSNGKAIDNLQRVFADFADNYDNPESGRDHFFKLMTEISASIVSMNGNKQKKVHRSILITLKECMDTFNPNRIDPEAVPVIRKVISNLKKKDPAIDQCNEMRNKLIVSKAGM